MRSLPGVLPVNASDFEVRGIAHLHWARRFRATYVFRRLWRTVLTSSTKAVVDSARGEQIYALTSATHLSGITQRVLLSGLSLAPSDKSITVLTRKTTIAECKSNVVT